MRRTSKPRRRSSAVAPSGSASARLPEKITVPMILFVIFIVPAPFAQPSGLFHQGGAAIHIEPHAGDYAIFECKGIKPKVVMSMPEKGDVGFQEWIRDPQDGQYRGGKELPRRLFRVEDHGDRVLPRQAVHRA